MPDLTGELLKAEKALDEATKDLLKTVDEKSQVVWQARSRLNKMREVRGRIVARDYDDCPSKFCDGGWIRPAAAPSYPCKVCGGLGKVVRVKAKGKQ